MGVTNRGGERPQPGGLGALTTEAIVWIYDSATGRCVVPEHLATSFDLPLQSNTSSTSEGRDLLEWFQPEDRKAFESQLQACLTSGLPVEFSAPVRSAQGERCLRCTAQLVNNQVAGFAVFESVQAHDPEASLEVLGSLARRVAHDLNNILSVVLGNAEAGLSAISADDPSQQANYEQLTDVREAAVLGSEINKQMLDFLNGNHRPEEKLSTTELVSELAKLLVVFTRPKAQLKLELAEHLPALLGDRSLIHQAVLNLVINAANHSSGGEIVVQTGQAALSTEALQALYLGQGLSAGRYTYVEVRDSGEGIPPERFGKIFEPGYTTRSTGRGIGLAVVRAIVQQHRGAIGLSSEPDRGTRIRLWFPVADQTLNLTENRTVMVVDDEVLIRTSARRLLNQGGFEVITASSGEEALRLYQEADQRIGAVLLDLRMPEMDGESTFAELQRIDPAVRVVFVSGYREVEPLRLPIKQPPFLSKPLKYDALMDTLNRTIG